MAGILKSLMESCESKLDENSSLLKVLKAGNYKLAAEIILDPVNGSTHLCEDDIGVKSLSMVLSGGESIHLYLAKLMVERGVDVNFRIRDEEHMFMFSCFEQLINLILDVNRKLKIDCFLTPHLIGINNQPVKTLIEARVHLIELLKIFLEFGGDPNFRSGAQGCTLFHKILKSSRPDIEVIRILHAAGGDVNKAPRIGFPPVVSLINNSFCDNTLPIVKQIWMSLSDEIYIHSGPGSARNTTVANSALMVAMHTASTASALFFIEKGAQFDTVRIFNTNHGKRDTISCLFLPLLHLSLPYFKYYAAVTLKTNDNYLKDYVFSFHNLYESTSKKCNKALICKVVLSSLSPVVDAIIERPFISETEIENIINNHTYYTAEVFFQHCSFTSIVSALFGQSSTTLQQLCIRSIFDNTFFNKPTLDIQKLIHRLKYPAYSDRPCLAEYVIHNVKSMVNDLNDVVVKNLIDCLRLPSKLNILFQLEAARLQVYLNLNAYDCLEEFCEVPSRTGSCNSILIDNPLGSDGSDYRMETNSELDDSDAKVRFFNNNDDDDDDDDTDDSDYEESNSSYSEEVSEVSSTPSNLLSSAKISTVSRFIRYHRCGFSNKHHDSGDNHDDDNNDDRNDDNECNCFTDDNEDEECLQSYNELSEISSSFDSSSLSLS